MSTNGLEIEIPYFLGKRFLYLTKICCASSTTEEGEGATTSGAVKFPEDFFLVVLLNMGDGGLALDIEIKP